MKRCKICDDPTTIVGNGDLHLCSDCKLIHIPSNGWDVIVLGGDWTRVRSPYPTGRFKWRAREDDSKKAKTEGMEWTPVPTVCVYLNVVVTMSKGQQTTFGETVVTESEGWATCDKRIQNSGGKYSCCGNSAILKIHREGNIPNYRCEGCAKDTHKDMAGIN